MQKIMQADFVDTIFEPLLQLSDCPQYMYYIGALPDCNYKLITIVGSRTHSTYAKQALELITSGLSDQQVCVISGLALGIDALAHKSALNNNVTTISVPGSGLDESVLYPATNRNLAHAIVTSGGCIISEFEPTDRAARWTFPKRNRIMAAISDLTIVIEAAEQSGTLITARNALEYNKEVAVIPGSIFNEQAIGSNKLLQDGAHVITCTNDVLQLLGLSQVAVAKKIYNDVNEQEKLILDNLNQPLSRDQLMSILDITVSEFAMLLSMLEIKGHVKEQLGLIYKI